MSCDRPNSSTHCVFERGWNAYYEAVAGRPPRETLLAALDQFDAEPMSTTPRFAVDLGCGDGRDTIELLRRNWRVLGIDGEEEALSRLKSRSELNQDNLETRIDRFETLTLPDGIDLINASFCLPFCHPESFPHLWHTITQSLRTGGRFCGQLFGDRDSWAKYPNGSHFSRAQVEELLIPFAVELLNEEEHPGKTALGEEKDWHIFHIVAKKR